MTTLDENIIMSNHGRTCCMYVWLQNLSIPQVAGNLKFWEKGKHKANYLEFVNGCRWQSTRNLHGRDMIAFFPSAQQRIQIRRITSLPYCAHYQYR